MWLASHVTCQKKKEEKKNYHFLQMDLYDFQENVFDNLSFKYICIHTEYTHVGPQSTSQPSHGLTPWYQQVTKQLVYLPG